MRTTAEEGAPVVRRGFEGGVAGGFPPHKGGPKARPPKKQEWGVRDPVARLRHCHELTVAETLQNFWGGEKGRYEMAQ